MTFIGIDVGVTGGLVALDDDARVVAMQEMPTKAGDNGKADYDIPEIASFLSRVCIGRHIADMRVAVERQQVMRGDGGVSGGAIMHGFGIMRGIVETHTIEGQFVYVYPQTWMAVAFREGKEICGACGFVMTKDMKPLKETPEQKAKRERKRLELHRHGRYCPKCLKPIPQKGRSLDAFNRLFPGVDVMRRETERCKWKPHLGLVDAALIAYWLWKVRPI